MEILSSKYNLKDGSIGELTNNLGAQNTRPKPLKMPEGTASMSR
jgi:hypothetical protein